MFTKTTILASLMALTNAAPAPAPAPRAVGDHFTLLALASATPVQYAPIHAWDNAFWIGFNTSTSCPLTSGCPAGTDTAFTAGTNGTLSMDTEVPGGQTVYIDKFGVLRFTAAHSHALPEDSVTTGFVYTPAADGSLGRLTFGVDEILACPAQKEGGYLIFVKTGPISIPEGCIDISFGAAVYEGVAAWEYD